MTDNKLIKREDNPLLALQASYPEAQYMLLAPKTHIGSLPVGTQIVVREVRVDPRPDGPDVYKVDGGKVALTKVALNRIAAAAGITWVEIKRVDNRAHPYYCECMARARVTDFDGTVRESVGTKVVDLRDDAGGGIAGKDRQAMGDRQLTQARKYISELCASKAMNRAIADVLAVRRSYHPVELQRPFIVPKLVLDTSNAMARQAVIATVQGAIGLLYGRQEPKVVDAEIEENAAPNSGECVEAAGDFPPPSPAASEPPDLDEEPPHDPVTGEVLTPESIKQRIGAAWNRAAGAGIDSAGWRSLIRNAAKSQKYEQMDAEDLRQIEAAVDAYVQAAGGSPCS